MAQRCIYFLTVIAVGFTGRRCYAVNLHFFEEVPVGDDLELLQDKEDPTANEEGLMLGQSLVQQQQVPLTDKHRWFTCENA